MSTDSATNSSTPKDPAAPSLRWRIAWPVAVYALLIIIAQATAILLMFVEREEELIDGMLAAQLAHSIEVWRAAPEAAMPNTPDMMLYRMADGESSQHVPETVRELAVGKHEVYFEGREFHIAVRAEDGVRFALVYDVEENERRIRGLAISALASAIPLALVTLVLAYALSGHLARQIEALAGRVGQGSGGSHVTKGMVREVLRIAKALDAHEQTHERLLERERDLTANLAHELRTPLTGIRTDAELVATLPAVPPAAARRANRIIERADEIARLADSLLVLAREAQPRLLEPVCLADATRRQWVLTALHGKPFTLRLELPENAVVVTDPSLLDLILRNLFDNAIRHAPGGEIFVRLVARRLEVRDHGPGFTAEALPQIFDRHFRGPGGGHGVGLALVRHVCLACGWQVSAANAEPETGGGALLSVDFDEVLMT